MDEALSGGIGSRPFTDTQISNLAQLHIERLEVISTEHYDSCSQTHIMTHVLSI